MRRASSGAILAGWVAEAGVYRPARWRGRLVCAQGHTAIGSPPAGWSRTVGGRDGAWVVMR